MSDINSDLEISIIDKHPFLFDWFILSSLILLDAADVTDVSAIFLRRQHTEHRWKARQSSTAYAQL